MLTDMINGVFTRRFAGLITAGVVFGACATTTSAPAPAAKPEAVAEGGIAVSAPRALPSSIPFVSLEGPFWVDKPGTLGGFPDPPATDSARQASPRPRDGGYLIFSDVVEQNGAAAKIYRYDPGSGSVSVVPYPQTPTSTNGLAVDGQGRIVACERWNGALVRVDAGTRAVLADRAPGTGEQSLNAPNDLTLRSDGNIYFTDTKWGARPGAHAPTAVYRIAPDGVVSVAFAVDMPNGVLLSPDGATLYVGSDAQDRVWRLPVAPDGSVGAAAPFVDAHSVPGGKLHVPDGLCTDDRGRIYVTNNSDDVSAIEVFDSSGRFAGRIPIPAPPSNCTFGGADRKTLYVTTLHAVYEVRVETPGLP